MRKKVLQAMLIVLFCLGLSVHLCADRINTIGISGGIIASADDRPYISGLNLGSDSDEVFFVGSFFPRINLSSRGPASLFSIYYGFGMNRVNSDLDLNTESHSVGMEWNAALGARGSFSLSSNFRKSPDIDSFTIFSGIVETPDGYFFDFDTVALQRDSYWSSTSTAIGVDLSERAELEFLGGFSFKNFEELSGFREEDQIRTHGGVNFSRAVTERTSWYTGYEIRYWEYYGGASSAYSHNADFGLRHMFSPSFSLNLSAGPAYVIYTGDEGVYDNETGYNAQAALTKRIERHLFSLSYNERSAATYGAGGIVKSRDAGLSYSRDFERILLNASVRYFKTESIFESGYSPEGVFSMVSLGFKLARSLMLEVGGSYRKQDDNNSEVGFMYADYERKRAFFSIRFNFPELWRVGG